MPEKFEQYSHEKAWDESEKMKDKVKSGEAKNYSEAEKLINTQENKEKDPESLLVSLEELIPEIKQSQKPRISEKEPTGHKFDDSYATDLFFKKTWVFNNYFLKKENQEEVQIILDLFEKCENKEQWKNALGEKKLTLEYRTFSDLTGLGLRQFKDQIFVDLGCGDHAIGYNFASLAGAKGYVGVDMYYGDRFEEGTGFSSEGRREVIEKLAKEKDTIGTEAIPASFSADDILTFLKRLPDNSVSIFASGIDHHVLNADTKYISEITKEISRVLSDKGIFMSDHSCFYPEDLKNETEFNEKMQGFGINLYKKNKSEKNRA